MICIMVLIKALDVSSSQEHSVRSLSVFRDFDRWDATCALQPVSI